MLHGLHFQFPRRNTSHDAILLDKIVYRLQHSDVWRQFCLGLFIDAFELQRMFNVTYLVLKMSELLFQLF